MFRCLCLGAILCLCGCPSASLRTAETLEPGQFGGGVGLNFTIPELGPDLPDPAPIDVFNGIGFVYYLSYGLPGACEATVGMRAFNPYLEARCGITQERLGGPLSIAPGVGVMWSIYEDASPWEVRGWVDVSKRFGESFSPLMRVEYAWGPIFKHVYRGDQPLHIEQGPYSFKPTNAGRLHVTLGGAIHLGGDEGVGLRTIMLGVTPYWVLHTQDPDLPLGGWTGSFGIEFH